VIGAAKAGDPPEQRAALEKHVREASGELNAAGVTAHGEVRQVAEDSSAAAEIVAARRRRAQRTARVRGARHHRLSLAATALGGPHPGILDSHSSILRPALNRRARVANHSYNTGSVVRVRRGCISSRRHVKAWPRTSGPLSPYTLRKYGARQTCLVRLRLAQQRDEEERSDDPGWHFPEDLIELDAWIAYAMVCAPRHVAVGPNEHGASGLGADYARGSQ
jgi:hypothetical protein